MRVTRFNEIDSKRMAAGRVSRLNIVQGPISRFLFRPELAIRIPDNQK